MGWNGAGTYITPVGNPVSAGTTIQSLWANGTVTDFIGGFNNTLPRDGQAPMSGQLKLIDGNSSTPSIAFTSDSATGLYRPGVGLLGVTVSGVPVLQFSSTGVIFPAGTAANPSLKLNDTDTGIYSPGVGQFAISTNGVQTLFIDTLGNLTTSVIGSTLTSSGSLAIGTGGNFSAGTIYSDSTVGMKFTAKQASPSAAQFGWIKSDLSESMRLDPNSNLLPGVTASQDLGSAARTWNNIYVASQNGGQLAGFRNRIINGAMGIDQRLGGGATTPLNSVYVGDRWICGVSQATKLTLQTVFDAPAGFYASIKISVASSFIPGTNDAFSYCQVIEANNVTDFQLGKVAAQSIAISFWVKGSAAGTYSGSLRNSGNTRSYAFTYPVTSTWTKQTVIVPGDTAGTWVNGGTGIGLQLLFELGAGSTYRTTAGSWQANNFIGATGSTSFVSQSNGSTLNITGVQLEIGTVATPYEQRGFGTELALCQRYYEVINNDCVSYGAAGGNMGGRTKYVVTKRVNATVTLIANNVNYSQVNVNSSTCTYVGTSIEGTTHYRVVTATGGAQYSELASAAADF